MVKCIDHFELLSLFLSRFNEFNWRFVDCPNVLHILLWNSQCHCGEVTAVKSLQWNLKRVALEKLNLELPSWKTN